MIEKEPQKSVYQKTAQKTQPTNQSIDPSVIQSQSMQNSKYELLSGFLDGELTQQEAQKVMLLLESDGEYKQLHDEMTAMRHEVQSLSLQDSELEHLDKLFQEPVAKVSRLFGFAVMAVSSFVLVAFTLYSIFINEAISMLIKILSGALGVGGLALLFSVLRQRLISRKNDKYNRVKI